MRLPRRTFLKVAAGAVALPALPHTASAQAPYPSKPITIIVPYAAGGPTDTIARILAERLRMTLGQTIIIENTTGAGGTIAVARVARAAPDGYTIGIGQNGSHVVTGATYQRLPYDLLNDFQPLTLLTDVPTVDEAGLPGYHVSLWHGFWMPKGTPEPIMTRLNEAVVEALADPTVQSKLAMIGQDIFPRERQNPQGLDTHQKAEIAKWWP